MSLYCDFEYIIIQKNPHTRFFIRTINFQLNMNDYYFYDLYEAFFQILLEVYAI